MNYFFRYFFFEFKSKFFIDSYSRIIFKVVPNFFYFDVFIFGFNYFFFGCFRLFSFFFLSLFRGARHAGVLIVFFFALFFLFL